jgi:hypothetical protein
MAKLKLYPDPTRNKKFFYWKPTYDFTVNYLNNNIKLKIGCEVGVAGGQNIKNILENCPQIIKMFGILKLEPTIRFLQVLPSYFMRMGHEEF